MIVRVCERTERAQLVSRTIVATDDERIHAAVVNAGFECAMTRYDHQTGTDRLAEVAEAIDCDYVVNVQGDEPLIAPATIDAAIAALDEDPEAAVSTTCERIDSVEEYLDPNVVKVVVRSDRSALYFSRGPIPYPFDAASRPDPPAELIEHARKHTGLYVYRRDFLLRFPKLARTPLERLERLEQLRALEHGYRIRVVEVPDRSIGVDTQADLDRVRSLWKEEDV